MFNAFIKYIVLLECNAYLGRNLVLVMDNASFYYLDEIYALCKAKGVKLIYLPPYLPDFNPIEEFFSQLKAAIRR